MMRRYWFAALPVAVLGALGGRMLIWPSRAHADSRLVTPRFRELEAQVGYHLYAPTWVPYGGRPGTTGPDAGVFRIMQEYYDTQERAVLIISQERRTPERDRYNRKIFIDHADARATVRGHRAVIVPGVLGDRRLFWQEKDSSVILSSPVLTDAELIQTARSVR